MFCILDAVLYSDMTANSYREVLPIINCVIFAAKVDFDYPNLEVFEKNAKFVR